MGGAANNESGDSNQARATPSRTSGSSTTLTVAAGGIVGHYDLTVRV